MSTPSDLESGATASSGTGRAPSARAVTFSVLHVLPSLDPRRGGPVRAVTELVAGLAEAGIPSAIAVPARESRWGSRASLVPCSTWRVPRGPLVRLPRSLPLPPPTVVHVHGIASLVPWSPFLAGERRGPVVGTLHGTLDRRLAVGVRGMRGAWHRRMDVPLLRRLDGIHATRPSEVASARGVLAGRRDPVCLPWTLARSQAGTPTPPRPRVPFLLYAGRLHPIKGIERLLAAFRLVAARAPAPRLLLAGVGDRAYVATLSRRAEDLGVRGRVEFLGLVDPEPLRALYAEASVLVLPSLYENFGMVVLEALREGCPVIAARETPWEALEAEGVGRWLEFGDADAVASASLEALDPARRESAAPRCRAFFERAYSPPAVIPRFTSWYEDVVRRTANGPVA